MANWVLVEKVCAFNRWILGPEQERLVVDRAGDPLGELRTLLGPESMPRQVLMMGSRGTGKSQELLRLSWAMRDQLFPLYLHIGVANREVTVPWLVASILASLSELVDRLGIAFSDGIAKRLERLGRPHEVEETSLDYGVDLEAAAQGIFCLVGGAPPSPPPLSLPTGFTFRWSRSRRTTRESGGQPSEEDLVELLQDALEDLQEQAGRPLLLIVDGIDRLEDPPDAAVRLFAASEALTAPRVRMVYVAPVTLAYDPRAALARQLFCQYFLPNVKLHERGRPESTDEEGYRTMRTIVERRLQEHQLSVDSLFARGALDQLIGKSGGTVRMLLQLVSEAARSARKESVCQITAELAARVVGNLERQWQLGLTAERMAALIEARRTGLPGQDDVSSLLVQAGYLMPYHNQQLWWEVHPLVLPAVQEAEKRGAFR